LRIGFRDAAVCGLRLVGGDRCQDLRDFLVALSGAGLLLLMSTPAQRGGVEPGVAAGWIGTASEEVSDDICAAAERRLVQGSGPVDVDSVHGCRGGEQLVDHV